MVRLPKGTFTFGLLFTRITCLLYKRVEEFLDLVQKKRESGGVSKFWHFFFNPIPGIDKKTRFQDFLINPGKKLKRFKKRYSIEVFYSFTRVYFTWFTFFKPL